MKITRYVNGQKRTKPFNTDIVIENEEISSVISRVNRRISGLKAEVDNGAENE